ncbi:transcriptional regulator, TetR family [Bacillus sp. JCM 19046]|nr:transcriptional regulator, TetR family [Bacillus sp. JCM 19045]GAF19041.1 transcriptional regulator, TetR family [Bacillus sp. JCM 19046]
MNTEPNEGKADSLRERKKIKVYEDIESIALNLFLEKGYDNTSIKEIADVLMMSSRTFFRYFSSKEALLTEPLRSIHTEAINRLKTLDSNTTVQAALRFLFLELAETYERKRKNLSVRYQIAKQTPATSVLFLHALIEAEPVICAELSKTLERGVNRRQLKFEVGIHMAAFRVAAEEWLSEEETNVPLAEIIETHFSSLNG